MTAQPASAAPETATMAEFGRMIGCSRQMVQKHKEQNRLVLDERGRVLVQRSKQLIDAAIDPTRGGKNRGAQQAAPAAAAPGVPQLPLAPAPVDPADLSTVTKFQDARLLSELETVRAKRRDRALAEGALLAREPTEREAFRLARATLDRALSMVDRTSRLVAPMTDPIEIAEVLEKAILKAFGDIAELARRGEASEGQAS